MSHVWSGFPTSLWVAVPCPFVSCSPCSLWHGTHVGIQVYIGAMGICKLLPDSFFFLHNDISFPSSLCDSLTHSLTYPLTHSLYNIPFCLHFSSNSLSKSQQYMKLFPLQTVILAPPFSHCQWTRGRHVVCSSVSCRNAHSQHIQEHTSAWSDSADLCWSGMRKPYKIHVHVQYITIGEVIKLCYMYIILVPCIMQVPCILLHFLQALGQQLWVCVCSSQVLVYCTYWCIILVYCTCTHTCTCTF